MTCKSLGLDHGIASCCSAYGYFSSASISIDGVKCAGNESALLDCPHVPAGHADCFYYDYAAVACYNGIKSQGKSTNASVGILA